MEPLHKAVLELLEKQSLNPDDYISPAGMYKDSNCASEIDALIGFHVYTTRDDLVQWVCAGYLEYLDMAIYEYYSEDDAVIIMCSAHEIYLNHVAYNAVVSYMIHHK
jgi:hypothetical protein